MTPMTALVLPIFVSAVFVFVASSLIHMLLGWHKGDYPPMPSEDKVRDSLRPLAIPPGDYMVPAARSNAELKSPEFQQKVNEGPVMVVTVLPSGPFSMGRNLGLWFVYLLVVSFFSAYISSRALAPGAHYLEVFRFAGATAFFAYSAALWQMSIWYQRKWSTTIKSTIDGLIYGFLTAGVFGWLWPAAQG